MPRTTLKNTKCEVIYSPPCGEPIIREKLVNLEKHGFLKSVKVRKEKLYLNEQLLRNLVGK